FFVCFFFFSSRRRHTRSYGDWSSDVCSSDLDADRRVLLPRRGALRASAQDSGGTVLMATITFDHISKIFDETAAVNDLNIEVDDGEFLVLVGPSGCGKTTALRMLAGLETISKGRILIGDRVVNNVAPGARDVAMVFQSYALYP